MGRTQRVAAAILRAIRKGVEKPKHDTLTRILFFFSVFSITLERYDGDTFQRLRRGVWKLNEEEYRGSFSSDDELEPAGDLGYSGSTFFTTKDGRYLVKSIPRRSEYKFFTKELLRPYEKHMMENPASLLVRITDFLHAPSMTIGALLRITPSHHVVMENILYGQMSDPRHAEWETYDLKPDSYFYPERDLAGGHLASDAVKDRLLDTFEDHIRTSSEVRNGLLDQLSKDSAMLEAFNVVDYSLFLIRYPSHVDEQMDSPMSPSSTSSWRGGITSHDKKWTYRAIILDFFWAKHHPHAKAMTLLISTFNIVGRKGHMSITTDSKDYRRRFMAMAESLFDVTPVPAEGPSASTS